MVTATKSLLSSFESGEKDKFFELNNDFVARLEVRIFIEILILKNNSSKKNSKI